VEADNYCAVRLPPSASFKIFDVEGRCTANARKLHPFFIGEGGSWAVRGDAEKVLDTAFLLTGGGYTLAFHTGHANRRPTWVLSNGTTNCALTSEAQQIYNAVPYEFGFLDTIQGYDPPLSFATCERPGCSE
jgi:hypothetical protein